jgi:bacteriocin biosynthesis cyclodehydratase domain-containing protein
LIGPDRVRLIAGEDLRYTLEAPGLERWLPDWLPKLDGRLTVEQVLATAPPEYQAAARQLVARLYGERVLIEAPTAAAHRPGAYCLSIEGDGLLAAGLASGPLAGDGEPSRAVAVLCQDRLDYSQALRFNDLQLRAGRCWFWMSVGPLHRGYVSPLFLPDAGPCLRCLLNHFRRMSPSPDVYDELIDHAGAGGRIEPALFPPHGIGVLQQLLLWKVELLREPEAPAALYQLHVLEVGPLEVTAHRVFSEPECPACSGHR